MKAQPLQTIFFDAAGTLFSLREPVGLTYARIGLRHGARAGPDALDKAFRAAWRSLPTPLHPENKPPADDDRAWWRELVRRTFAGASEDTATSTSEPLFEELYAHYARAAAWRIHDDVPENLRRLSETFELYVLSNFDGRLRRILRELGISGHFKDVILSSEVGAAKPHPRIFQAGLETCGRPAARNS